MKSLKVMLLGIAVAACGAAFSSMGVISWIFGIVGILLALFGFFMRGDRCLLYTSPMLLTII